MGGKLKRWFHSIGSGVLRRMPLGVSPPVPRRHRIRAQLRRHSVAMISLLIAISSLGYNTWRNETSELHRNWRQASFELTREIKELQQVVLYRRYFHPVERDSPAGVGDAETWIRGWGRAASVRDLTSVLPDPLPARGVHLHTTWAQHAQHLNAGDESAREAEEALLAALDDTRDSVLELIRNLR